MITYRAARNLIGLSVTLLVVHSLSVTHHGHNKGESNRGPSVFIGIEEDSETFELVRRSKYRARGTTLFRQPHRKAISKEVALAMDFELDFNLNKSEQLEAANWGVV